MSSLSMRSIMDFCNTIQERIGYTSPCIDTSLELCHAAITMLDVDATFELLCSKYAMSAHACTTFANKRSPN